MHEQFTANTNQAQCLVLAGGKGSRLSPLTDQEARSKPSLQLGDSNIMIDPSLIATGKVASEVVVASRGNLRLKRHLDEHYDSRLYTVGLETEQRETGYVVFDNREKLYSNASDTLIVTPADHLHSLDFKAALGHHLNSGANVTIIGMKVVADEASAHDVLNVREDGQVIGFLSKQSKLEEERKNLISIGTYIFQKETLLELISGLELRYPSKCDIGNDLLPRCFQDMNVDSYEVSGYWKDLGTIDRYYEGNMYLMDNPESLVAQQLDLHIGTGENLADSLIAPKSEVSEGAYIKHSIVGEGAEIGPDTFLEDAIVMPYGIVTAGSLLRRVIINESAVASHSTGIQTEQGVRILC